MSTKNRRLFLGLPALSALVFSCGLPDESNASGKMLGNKSSSQQVAMQLNSSDGSGSSSDDLVTLGKENVVLKSELSKVTGELEREQDRYALIKKELTQDLAVGCWAAQKIEKFEIIVAGSGPSSELLWETVPNSPLANQFKYRFGDELVYTNANEMERSMIRPEGMATIVSSFNGREVGEIQEISIEKGGVAVTKDDRTVMRRGLAGAIGLTKQVTDYIEQNIFSISSVSIKVNDRILYQNDGIGQSFRWGSLSWRDTNLIANRAYRVLMADTSCVQRQ